MTQSDVDVYIPCTVCIVLYVGEWDREGLGSDTVCVFVFPFVCVGEIVHVEQCVCVCV